MLLCCPHLPQRHRYRLDLEDASQIQIARVVRGIWGRNTALRRRQELQRMMEQKYIENPYHPLHRRNVLRVLRSKYAPVFLAQDISARRIQAPARRYLYYARIRWSLSDQRAKFIQQLVRSSRLHSSAKHYQLYLIHPSRRC